MNTLITSNTIEPPETPAGREYAPEASRDAAQPSSNGSRLKHSRLIRPDDNGVSDAETAYANADECTYETDEIDEAEEAEETQEPEELEEKEELATLGPKLSMAIDDAISECRVSANRNVNRPLFILAHKVRSIEEELNARFSMDVIADILHRWKEQNRDHLEDDHDYLAEFLDKLWLVRFPRGRALAMAVETAKNIVPPEQTLRLSSDFQLLATLCGALQQQRGQKPFFLDGRAAAIALGKPHETVASWLRALCRLGVIRLISKGRRGVASRYVYPDQSVHNHGSGSCECVIKQSRQ
jgi:hypothetical protein